jgi:SAM-dependent methyltransferase
LHHFPQPRQFITEARRVLKPSGAVVIINMDPHAGRDRWYLYDYFDGTYETDLRRFPSSGTLTDWLIAARFDRVEWSVAEHLRGRHTGRAVLDDYFLQKHSTSQLALLSDDAYAAGLARLHADLDEAEAAGQMLSFEAEVWLVRVVGYRE